MFYLLCGEQEFWVCMRMSSKDRKNQSGGSAGGGGYDYQAEAYALVAAKILAEETLIWADTGCDRVPVSVRVESGTGGDDLRILLRSGKRIELQAKSGLQRGRDLWDALLALARSVNHDANTYGVLLTNGSASGTVKDDLKEGIERIGRNFENLDELSAITQDFRRRLKEQNLDASVICKRLFIRVWDFTPGSPGEEATFSALRKVITQPEQAGAARRTFVSDGFDLIKLRGSSDATDFVRLLHQDGIALSHKVDNTLVEHTSHANGIVWEEVYRAFLKRAFAVFPFPKFVEAGTTVDIAVESRVIAHISKQNEKPPHSLIVSL